MRYRPLAFVAALALSASGPAAAISTLPIQP